MMDWRVSCFALTGISVLIGFVGTPQNRTKVPTFSKDIAPILYKRCVSCHSDSGVAPFSLIGYENARRYAETIATVTQSGFMPPWKAKPNYGEFRDIAALTPGEKNLLARWANAGAPEGNATETPPPPSITPGWRLGAPDLIVVPEKSTKIPSEGRDFFRNYLFDPKITKPTWVRAVDFRPGRKGTVHHIIPGLIKKEDVEKLRKIKPDYEDNSWESKTIKEIDPYNTLGFWSTGAPPFESPPDTAFLIQPGDCFLLNVHYKTQGKVEQEHIQVGLYYLSEPPKHEMTVRVVATGDIYIQPNEVSRAYAIGDELTHPVTLYAVWPHMHYLGRTMKAWVKFPAGYSKPLVAIGDWDPEWQLLYYLKTPMYLPAGSRVYVTGTYDNSTNNPRNPNSPPKVIEAGESATDEMLFFELFHVEHKPPAKKSPPPSP